MGSTLRGFEPPEQRLTRLRNEVADLLSAAEDSVAQETAGGTHTELQMDNPAAVAAELRVLEQRLGGLARDSADIWKLSSQAGGGNSASVTTASSLAVQLERLASGETTSLDAAGAGGGHVTYEINYAPSGGAVSNSSKIAALESQLASVEKQLGVFDQSCPFADLQTAVTQLQRRLSVLDPQKIEAIRSGAQKALGEVDAVLQKKSQLEGVGSNPELDRKANELYEFCHRWSAVAPSLPALVSRLQSLQALHQESGSFASRLGALEQRQEELATLLDSTATAVQDLSKGLQENMTIVRDSMKGLEQKMAQVANS